MLPDVECGLLKLIYSAINNKKTVLPENLDFGKIYNLASSHQIVPLIFYGALVSDAFKSEETKQKFFLKTCKCFSVSANQQFEIQKLKAKFEQNGINYLLLKGSEIRDLYPNPEMRIMGDADILIKNDQYSRIKEIMLELGFTENVETEHEYTWNKAHSICVELHKCLVSPEDRQYYRYFGDGWKYAIKNPGSTCYYYSDEENLIYIFTHLTKHYRNGGIGLRQFIDIYVFLENKPKLDNAYVQSHLAELNLDTFYKNVINTLDVWFNGKPENKISEIISKRVFGSGSFGTNDSHVISKAAEESQFIKTIGGIKFKKTMGAFFLPYQSMKRKYPVLKRFPFLLPVMWISRGVSSAVWKHDKIKNHTYTLSLINSENIESFQNELSTVGLDFKFKE